MSKSRKHLKRRNTSKKKTFRIQTPSGISSIKAVNGQCAVKIVHRKALKTWRNSWAYISKIIKTPEPPRIENFKLTF